MFAGVVFMLAACEKPNTKGGEDVDFPDINGFNSSAEVGRANLVSKWSFEDNVNDSTGNVTGGTPVNVTYVQGIKGKAYKGATNAWIAYSNAGNLPTLTSFSVAFWINTAKHGGGAQGVFALPRTGAFWANFFVIIEGNTGASNKMLTKLHFEKHNPPVPNVEHWVELAEAFRPDQMYGQWKHIVYSYDELTSKASFYVDGQIVNMPANVSDRKSGVGNDGLGALSFKDAQKFIIGGFQNQLGAPFNTPEPWMLPYTGMLDEFKIFKKPLTSNEIDALYRLEKQGR